MKIKTTKTNKSTLAEPGGLALEEPKRGKWLPLASYLPFSLFDGRKNVAVLRLSGIIGGSGPMGKGMRLEDMNDLIEKAFSLPRLLCVCLVVNSPGGSPVQSEFIAKRIIDLSKKKNVATYSFVEDVAASGGYWLACAGDEIYASKSSIIGSVGVISSSFGFQDAISKLGIERRVYTQGKNKSILDPFQPVKKSDVDIIKHLQKHIHEHFINYVKSRRKGKLTQEDDILFSGEFWDGTRAADFGLIDGIADLYGFIEDKFGDGVKIQSISQKQSWIKKRLGSIGKIFAENIAYEFSERLENKALEDRFKLR